MHGGGCLSRVERPAPKRRSFPTPVLAAALWFFPLLAYAGRARPEWMNMAAELWAGFEYPVLNVFLFLAIVALLSVAVLKRRHRSELLAVCLALSVVLHLLSLSLFSVMPIGTARLAVVPKAGVHRIAIGTVSRRESMVGQGLRSAPLDTPSVQPHARLAAGRAAPRVPPAEGAARSKADLPDILERAPSRDDVKTPGLPTPKTAANEPLAAVSEQPVAIASVRFAVPQTPAGASQSAPEAPGAPATPFEVAPAASASLLPRTMADAPQADVKSPSRLPAGLKMELVEVEGRAPEIKDAMQPVAAKSGRDRLDIPAQAVQEERDHERAAGSKPGAEVRLEKSAGAVQPAGGGQSMAAAPQPSDQPRLAALSVAADGPAAVEPKRHAMDGLDHPATADAARLDPLRITANQPLMAAGRPAGPGNNLLPARPDRTEWGSRHGKNDALPAALPAPTLAAAVSRSGLQAPSRLPDSAGMNMAAVKERQAEVQDAIRPAESKAGVVPLDARAAVVANGRPPGGADAIKPGTDVKLEKQAGGAPRTAERRMTATAMSAGQPRLAAASVAAEGMGDIARKQNDVGWVAVESAPDAARLEPVRMSGRQPLMTASLSGAPGQAVSSAAAGKAEWAASKEKSALPGVSRPMGGMPRAGVADPALSKEPTRIGLGGQVFAKPMPDAAGVRDAVSDMPAGRPGAQPLGDPFPVMAMAENDGRTAGPLIAEKHGSSNLPAVRQGGGTGIIQAADARAVPGRSAQIQVGGDGSGRVGSVIEGSGSGLQPRGSTSAGVAEQLAGISGNADAVVASISPRAQTAAGGAGGTASDHAGSGMRSAAMAPAKAGWSGTPGTAGAAAARLSPTGRSDIPAHQDSFVGRGSGGALSGTAGSAVAEEGPPAAGTSLGLTGGEAKALAGRVSMENARGVNRQAKGDGTGNEGWGRAALSLGKTGAATGGAITSQRISAAPGGAGGGQPAAPAGTLVVASGLSGAGRSSAAGVAAGEPLAAVAASAGSSSVGSPALAAPTIGSGGGGVGGSSGQGVAPAGTLRLAKAGGGEALPLGREGGGMAKVAVTMGGAAGRGPGRMELSLSEGPPAVRVTSDISAAPSEQSPRRSLLSVGSTPKPDFIPDKAIYQMRKPQKRRQFIKELGGTAQTEQAVEQALDWLSRAQSPDGRWDIDGFNGVREYGGAGDLVNEDVAVTGLSLLAYLGAGYTHLEDVHQETIRKALDWLLSCEKENGDLRGPGQMYSQAIATAALCEAYSLTGDARLREPVARAVRFIVEAQAPEAGWRYEPRNDSDTSVTGWQILALKSAQIAGIPVPAQTIQWTQRWLDQVRHGAEGGLYAYKPGHAVTPVMTAEGAFCQLFMEGEERMRGQAESAAYLMQHLPSWDPENRSVHLYYWYYATLALYLAGAKEFEAWNAALTKALLEGRRKSGPGVGSWDPVCHLGQRGGRIYSTAAGALCLEVYYRFLPVYKQK